MILDKSRKLVDSPSKDTDCDPQRNPKRKSKLSIVYSTQRQYIGLLAFVIRLPITAFLALHSAIPADGINAVAFDFALSTWIARSSNVFSGRFRI